MAEKTILVAGGAGFVGSHLCDRLIERGDRVICVDNLLTGSRDNLAHLVGNPDFTMVEHDIRLPLRIEGGVDQIYNLACPASPPRYQADPVMTMMISVGGTLNLLELAAAKGARLLQASTSEIYGDPEEHPQHEDYWGHVNCTGPRACYDEGKRAAETLCFDFARAGRADIRVARIFNTYGPRMQPDDGRIVSNLIIQALTGEPLTVYGTGAQTRSFCFISDLVAGLMALMQVDPNPGVPVNLGNPVEFTINELAAIVAAETGSRSLPVFLPLPVDDPQRRCPDIGRARALLSWEPAVALSAGLPETIAWFRGVLPAARERRVVGIA